VQRAILAGDRETGVTVMRLDEGLDTGPIVAQRVEPIDPADDAGRLGGRLAAIGAELLVATLATGDLAGRAQDDAAATMAPSITPEERWIAWGEPAATIERRVRALSPVPGARTRFRGADLRVLAASAGGVLDPQTPPGTLRLVGGAVEVATGEGSVQLLEVAPAGRSHMPADAWARGARPAPGERLG
jgi:methionyl-tRNA formyltransferase